MADPRDLERRVAELETEVSRLRGSRGRGVRYRSSLGLGDIPLLAIASGPDPERGEFRGHARGIVAIGDIATGVVAIGGMARGFLALGGLALGVISLGGVSVGALIAAGGLAVGSLAFGGGAIGGAALGGGAAGYYACGGGAVGAHVIDARAADPEAVAFFERYGLAAMCRGQHRR